MYSTLMIYLWDGPRDDRQELVEAEMRELNIPQTKQSIIVGKVMPSIPEFKKRRGECGGKRNLDTYTQFKHLVYEVLRGEVEFPATIDALVADIRKRVQDSLK